MLLSRQLCSLTYLFVALAFLHGSLALAHQHGQNDNNHAPHHDNWTHENDWLQVPKNLSQIGKSHGEIAVSSDGDIYVSVMGELGGLQVYSPAGEYLHNVKNAPKDIHGFVIKRENGRDVIYAPTLYGQSIVKMTVTGEILLTVDALSSIPKQYHSEPVIKPTWRDDRALKLTAIDVAADGTMYVIDGYGKDYIHTFDQKGNYITTFAGRGAPWHLHNCHKIAIDPRFTPKRILCADRVNGRLVHMKLDGKLIGNHAEGLRRPSAIAFYNDLVAVAEISGRVTLLDLEGKKLTTLGTNENKEEINHPRTPPEKWKNGVFTSPHGIAFDADGNLYVTEYSNFGRVLKFNASTSIDNAEE